MMRIALTLALVACAVTLRGVEARHDGWFDFDKDGVKDVYVDPSESVDKRVADLLSRMTLEEKSCQVATLYGSRPPQADADAGELGFVTGR